MAVSITVPEECVGDVIGDLNARRGRPLGMEPRAGTTEIRAEVPMAEMLNYGADLRSLTGGRGDYAMDLARYEQVPAQIVRRITEAQETQTVPAHAR
jgi:elongation factor G